MRPQQQPRSAAAVAAALAAALLALLLVAGPAAALPAPQGDLREQVYRNFREDLEEAPIPRSLVAARSLANGRVRRPMPSGLDSLSGVTFGTSKRLDPLSGGALGHQKRNFDKLDRLALNSLVKKNFDEIDRTGFDSFVKRNFNEIDSAGFDKFIKRNALALLWRHYRNHNH